MGLVGIEAVINAMKTELQAEMAAKVAALNALYADAYVLTAIAAASYYDYVPDPQGVSLAFPALVLVEEQTKREHEQSNSSLYVLSYNVLVGVLVRGGDALALTRLLWRYGRAVAEILVQPHSLAPTCTTCVLDASSPHQMIDPASGDLLQERTSRFIVMTAEATT